MSATLVSSNTTIKVNAAVTAARDSNGIVYTAPANGYAIVHVYQNGTFNLTMTAAGAVAGILNSQIGLVAFYLGPGHAIEITSYSSGYAYVYGVSFVNTP